jgi:hypothetical protein
MATPNKPKNLIRRLYAFGFSGHTSQFSKRIAQNQLITAFIFPAAMTTQSSDHTGQAQQSLRRRSTTFTVVAVSVASVTVRKLLLIMPQLLTSKSLGRLPLRGSHTNLAILPS